MKVEELIRMLESVDPKREVLMVHQQSWPMQITIAGTYDRLTAGERELMLCTDPDDECTNCGQMIGSGVMAWHWFEDDDAVRWEHETCAEARWAEEPEPLYLVEGGEPRDLSPYGPREAWGNMQLP